MTQQSRLQQIEATAAQALPSGLSCAPHYHAVAAQLQEWQLPDELVALGFLLGRIERGTIPLEVLSAKIGAAACAPAQAIEDLRRIALRPALLPMQETWLLFMLAYLSPQACLLKLADILVMVREDHTSADVPDDLLGATVDVCSRFGMWSVRTEILNIASERAAPELISQAREIVVASESARRGFFEQLQTQLYQLLARHGITTCIEQRSPLLYNAIETDLDVLAAELPWADLVQVFVLDGSDATCYRVLGLINTAYHVLGARLRDYIGGPKNTGYRAIHTFIDFKGRVGEREISKPVEIRILTPAMHDYNQRGLCADVAIAGQLDQGVRPWWRDRRRWQATWQGVSNEIFVFTPKGNAIFLPPKATVQEFAQRVHSELGIYCYGGRVNNVRVPLGQPLELGDICEVLIDRRGTLVSYQLFTADSTVVNKARLRRSIQEDKTGTLRGRKIVHEVLDQRLKDQDITASAETLAQQQLLACQRHGYQTQDAFFRAVVRGEAAPDNIVREIVDHLLIPHLDFSDLPSDVRALASTVRFAACCHPRRGQPIRAMPIRKGRQLKIHTQQCLDSSPTLSYPIAWKPTERELYVADAVYEGWDRPGLISQITRRLHSIGAINIRKFLADVPEESRALVRFSFETLDLAAIDEVRMVLETMPERRYVDVRRVVVIDEREPVVKPLRNVYIPSAAVGRWPMFVGRETETTWIRNLLTLSDPPTHILIHGPKRIGKSSLLTHLAHHHLQEFNDTALVNFQALADDELAFVPLIAYFSNLIVKKLRSRRDIAPLEAEQIRSDPINSFADFLSNIHQHSDVARFIILIDEFGTLFTRHPDPLWRQIFFDQWRALFHDDRIYRYVTFIVTMPDAVFNSGLALDQSRIGELGHNIRLSVLEEHQARELITAPVRAHVTYREEDMQRLLKATGCHPYYIHLVCSQIIIRLIGQQRTAVSKGRQEVPSGIIAEAIATIQSHNDAYGHVLNDSSPSTRLVLHAAARWQEASAKTRLTRMRQLLHTRGFADPDKGIARAVLERPDLLVQEGNDVFLRSELVARWINSQDIEALHSRETL